MSAREWMRRGFEADEAAWCASLDGRWFMRAIPWGARADRYRGWRRVARLAVLGAACRVVRLHRLAWRVGLRL